MPGAKLNERNLAVKSSFILGLLLGTMLLPVSSGAATESEKAKAFFEEAFTETMMRSPSFQAQLGIKDDYDKWDNVSDAFAQETNAIVKRQLDELKKTISYDDLDASTRLSYNLFVDAAERQLTGFRWRFHAFPVNQMYGWQSNVPAFLINYHRVDTVGDAETYIMRLERVGVLFDQVIEGLDTQAKKNIVPPKFVFPYVISDSKNICTGAPFDDSGEDSAILADFRKKVDALDIGDDEKSKLIARASTALTGVVAPAYDRLIAYVTALEGKATSNDGCWRLPDGDAYYAYRLNEMTTTDLTATEIHDIGVREVARIHDEMRGIMKTVEFDGTLQEFFAFMRTDPRFRFPDTPEGRQAYLEKATDIIATMKGKLGSLFTVTPKADIIVKPVEAFREKSAGLAFYQSPSPDGTRPGTYYVNLYNMAAASKYDMEALAYHEGIPGHHMQRAISIELDDIPTFRKYMSNTAYTEGWGLYSEFIPKEMGFYEDPYSDFGRLSMELWRACRLVVDTGIHDKHWSREQAIAYLIENTSTDEGKAVSAIERYIVYTGQATAYKIGMLKIQELRARAEDTLGDDFDIRAFHDLVLENGPLPLQVLESVIDGWIAGGGVRAAGSR